MSVESSPCRVPSVTGLTSGLGSKLSHRPLPDVSFKYDVLEKDYAEIPEDDVDVSRGQRECKQRSSGDYSQPQSRGYELNRNRVTLESIIGQGQFGDVYRGMYKSTKEDQEVPVAVKTCKPGNGCSKEERKKTEDKFLEEAMIMQQFDHQHIIKLIGICSDVNPVYIVMELARHGEMRAFLQNNKHRLDLATLILYSECY